MSVYLKFPSETDYNYKLTAAQLDTSFVTWIPYNDATQHSPTYIEHWDNMSVNDGGYIYAINVVAGRLYNISTTTKYDSSLRLRDVDGFIIKIVYGENYSSNYLNINFMAQETGVIYISSVWPKTLFSFTNHIVTMIFPNEDFSKIRRQIFEQNLRFKKMT